MRRLYLLLGLIVTVVIAGKVVFGLLRSPFFQLGANPDPYSRTAILCSIRMPCSDFTIARIIERYENDPSALVRTTAWTDLYSNVEPYIRGYDLPPVKPGTVRFLTWQPSPLARAWMRFNEFCTGKSLFALHDTNVETTKKRGP